MLNPKHFLRNSIGYEMLRSYLQFFQNYLYYRKVIIKSYPKDIPENTPLIFVSNHQNTLMDPFAILFNCGSLQPIFLARADVFSNDSMIKFLTFLKILPVYRQKDGVEDMNGKNDVIFEQCIELLQNNRSLVVFPEGNHGVQYKLRPLKKGTARIALRAESNANWELGTKIIPCGVHYTHCQKMGEILTVHYGQPIDIQDYKEEFLSNQPRTYSSLTNKIKERLLFLMLHIENEKYYDETLFLTQLNQTEDPLESGRATIEKLKALTPEKYEERMAEAAYLKSEFKKNNLDANVLAEKKSSTFFFIMMVLVTIMTFPMAVIGYVFNFIPFSLPLLITRKLEDKQFTSCYRFSLYFLITFPFYYLILFVVFINFYSFPQTLMLLLISAFLGVFAHRWARFADRIRQVSYLYGSKLKYNYLKLTSWD